MNPNGSNQTPFTVVSEALSAAGYPLREKPGILSGVRGTARVWVGKCPAHGGKSKNSLKLFVHDDGHVYPYCHSCSVHNPGVGSSLILATVNLALRDCWPAELRQQWAEEVFAKRAEEEVFALGEPRAVPRPTLAPEALIGLAGDFVRAVEPHTEADPVGLLVQFLILFGVMVGPVPHLTLDGSRHALNEFAALVGETSKGRKGTAWAHVEAGFMMRFPDFGDRVISGLTSGEGLIWEVRDRITKPGKDGRLEIIDPGVEDKRRLAMEHELSRVLRVQGREGNTLSAVVRDAWDGRVLRTLVKNAAGVRTGAVKASWAHVSIIGHITESELKRCLTETDAANGFANRFLWVCVQRSKVLPRGGGRVDWGNIPRRLGELRMFIDQIDEITLEESAWQIWDAVYEPLSEGKHGLFGALVARAEAHVMRLAALYALLDQAIVIQVPHLLAALALWDYCEASALHIFGRTLGDPNADAVLHAIRLNGEAGMTRTELHDYFSRHMSAVTLNQALSTLSEQNLISVVREKADRAGRPTERYFTWEEEADEPETYLQMAISSLNSQDSLSAHVRSTLEV